MHLKHVNIQGLIGLTWGQVRKLSKITKEKNKNKKMKKKSRQTDSIGQNVDKGFYKKMNKIK